LIRASFRASFRSARPGEQGERAGPLRDESMSVTSTDRRARPTDVAAPLQGVDSAGRPAIVLARHGRPALDRSKAVDWRGYVTWWAAYDDGGLAPGEEPPEDLLAVARDAHALLASPLTRSLETARAVAAGREVITDPVFIEAPLPPPRIPGLRLKPGQWGVVSRIAWWFGWSGGLESRKAAEARAEAAVDRVMLDLLAEPPEHRVVLVCAHGWFNRMMRPALRRRGWVCVRDGRDHYWSYRRYELAPGAELRPAGGRL
jgi:broad specificity phosphatase PhoE